MKTNMDVRSLGERESNYTNSSVHQMNQKKQKKSSYKKDKDNNGSGVIAASLLAGAGVGVLAGMLLAPKKGKDLRKQVTDSANKLSTQASDLYNTSKDKVTTLTGIGKKSGSSNANTSPRTNSTPNTNITPGREINNDPATSITM